MLNEKLNDEHAHENADNYNVTNDTILTLGPRRGLLSVPTGVIIPLT